MAGDDGDQAINYDPGPIHVLRGLQALRQRPAMYVGSVDRRGVLRALEEILNNALDQAIRGRATTIEVVEVEGGWRVSDDGPGIELESLGGWCSHLSHTPNRDGGHPHLHLTASHGLGLPIVNALGVRLTFEIARPPYRWVQTFSRGESQGPPVRVGKAEESGTTVTWLPDPEIFKEKLPSSMVALHLRDAAALVAGVRIVGAWGEFCFPQGLADLVRADVGLSPDDSVHRIQGGNDDLRVEVAWVITNRAGVDVRTFANGGYLTNGGDAEDGLRDGLGGFPQGLVARVSVIAREAKYHGRAREKLWLPEAREMISSLVRGGA